MTEAEFTVGLDARKTHVTPLLRGAEQRFSKCENSVPQQVTGTAGSQRLSVDRAISGRRDFQSTAESPDRHSRCGRPSSARPLPWHE